MDSSICKVIFRVVCLYRMILRGIIFFILYARWIYVFELVEYDFFFSRRSSEIK